MKSSWRYAVAGNIKKTRIDENGALKYGTATFKGNTKVYLCGRLWDERLPDKITGEMRVFRTAWMARPNGELVLVTPYGDDK